MSFVRILSQTAAIIWLGLIGLATAVSAEPAAPNTAVAHYDELLVSVSLNGVSVTENTLVLRDAGGAYYAAIGDVEAWNLTQKGRRSIEYHGQRYFALDDLTVSFDQSRGLLSLTASPTAFRLSTVTFQSSGRQPTVEPMLERGGFLNYDIAHSFGTQRGAFSGSFNGADTVLGGILSAGAVQPGNGSGFVRLNTTFERDDLPARTVLRFGDTVEAGGVLPLQRQFAGVQWGTDFGLEPSFSTRELPLFSGALPTDGTLDVILNGRQIMQQQLPAGPFVLQNMLVPAGSGNVTLVLRDANGRVQNIAAPYYESPILLRQGVAQFEFDAGVLRQEYGIASNAYDGTFVSAQGRRGVSHELTLGGALEGSAQSRSGSLAAAYLLPAIGQIAATLTGRTGVAPGLQQTYTYTYQGQHVGLGAQLMKSSPLYRDDTCQLPCTATSYQVLGNASAAIGKSSSLTLTFAHSITTSGLSSRTSEITYQRPIFGGRLNIDFLRSGPSPATTLFTVTYNVAIGARGWGTVSAVRGNGESGQTVSFDESLPSTATGFAYQVQAQTPAGGAATYDAQATEQLKDVTVSQQFFHGQDSSLFSTDVAGSIDFVDGKISLARTIGQGFGLVELPGYPGVLVYANGQEIGRTDGQGRLILPQLQPYQANDITLGTQDFPIGVDLVKSELEIAPYGLSPAIARFVVKGAGGVTLTLVDAQGAPLAAGTKILTADGKHQWIVGFDGLAYLDGVAAGTQHFSAATPTAACSFDLAIPKDTAQLPDLGRTTCR